MLGLGTHRLIEAAAEECVHVVAALLPISHSAGEAGTDEVTELSICHLAPRVTEDGEELCSSSSPGVRPVAMIMGYSTDSGVEGLNPS